MDSQDVAELVSKLVSELCPITVAYRELHGNRPLTRWLPNKRLGRVASFDPNVSREGSPQVLSEMLCNVV